MSQQDNDSVRAVQWCDHAIRLLDQRQLPHQEVYLTLRQVGQAAQAIQDMVVRGAPAIGITAAYGVVLAAGARFRHNPLSWKQDMAEDLALLARARPTAVNLSWALEQMGQRIDQIEGDPTVPLLACAQDIHQQDIAANHRMGELGAALMTAPAAVLTHCNTGSLATGGYGTALGVIRSAYRSGKIQHVFADETRPWLQGSRLTAWELVQDQIPVTLLVEGAAADLMRRGKITWVIVGADRIAANGDVANKIGTYSLAVTARHHGVKFMVVAPTSTVDLATATGSDIPIETRAAEEVLKHAGVVVACPGAQAWNPAFDVTPAALIDAIVTEKGVVRQPTEEKMGALWSTAPAHGDNKALSPSQLSH